MLFLLRVYSYSWNSRGYVFRQPKVVLRRDIEGVEAQTLLRLMSSRLYSNIVNIVNMRNFMYMEREVL